ncbi:hypothetical protein L596_005744 [Steinernema carpocapsae]|uniref:Uncharacterized protein n=1 Tax=Steinernema carpocapsae TaxID=34508 RepID=A0A4U8V1F7_STECR|nr:hypothetical protein L596_005744 [Steinernema carpocapsae]
MDNCFKLVSDSWNLADVHFMDSFLKSDKGYGPYVPNVEKALVAFADADIGRLSIGPFTQVCEEFGRKQLASKQLSGVVFYEFFAAAKDDLDHFMSKNKDRLSLSLKGSREIRYS